MFRVILNYTIVKGSYNCGKGELALKELFLFSLLGRELYLKVEYIL